MTKLPIADWQTALADMERGLAAMAAALDEYDAKFGDAVVEPAPAPDLLARVQDRLDGWDARLAAAEELTASAEKELADREAAVTAWAERLARWRERLQPSPAAVEFRDQ